MNAWLSKYYGAGAVHLVALVLGGLVGVYAGMKLVGADPRGVIVWLIGGALLHDLVLVPAYTALDRAARGLTGRHRITAERRDLSRRPLIEKELDKFDAVVFDPPRTGAAEQSQWLARSKVATVVAVSCNPATLARDLKTLVDGGYRLDSVTPVDQFLWSSHVEVVAVLRR